MFKRLPEVPERLRNLEELAPSRWRWQTANDPSARRRAQKASSGHSLGTLSHQSLWRPRGVDRRRQTHQVLVRKALRPPRTLVHLSAPPPLCPRTQANQNREAQLARLGNARGSIGGMIKAFSESGRHPSLVLTAQAAPIVGAAKETRHIRAAEILGLARAAAAVA